MGFPKTEDILRICPLKCIAKIFSKNKEKHLLLFKTKIMDDKQNVRKHLVFLLNYMLDNSKKAYLSADEMVLISNEVNNFKKYVSKANIDTILKAKLDKISFDYSPTRANASSSIVVVVLTIFTMGIYLLFLKLQELERKRMLVSFLNKYEDLLKLF